MPAPPALQIRGDWPGTDNRNPPRPPYSGGHYRGRQMCGDFGPVPIPGSFLERPAEGCLLGLGHVKAIFPTGRASRSKKNGGPKSVQSQCKVNRLAFRAI